MKVLLIACLLAALRPLETHSRINCAGLPGLQKNQAARILQAHEVSIGSLTLSKGGEFVLDKIPFCHIQGAINSMADDDATLDPTGNNTLTWELFLLDQKNYKA
ncbi:hypothetical protein ETB97_002220 [Aspergillus alliaceus]|uniref:Uncharacterized protein n=1 Tax=Petromyces alliaceus TaxID=209559 RepID=A0A8H6E576_PETAA|nr:hypothetical protein ETB97_002220 [Aspergillus burnettii]